MKLTSTREPASICAMSKVMLCIVYRLLETNSSSVPSSPSISAAPRKAGTRNTRILAMAVSNTASRKPPSASLADVGDKPDRQRARVGVGAGDAPGREQAADHRHVEQQLQFGRQIDQREMAAGIFQHHRLVHHGEFEMRRRIVDRDARVLGDRHHDQREQRKAERNAQAQLARHHEGGHGRKLRRARDQRQREHDHQHRRFGERGDHHLAAGADAAERMCRRRGRPAPGRSARCRSER